MAKRMPRSIEEAKREELANVGLNVAAQEFVATTGETLDGHEPFVKAILYGVAAMIRRETCGSSYPRVAACCGVTLTSEDDLCRCDANDW